MWPKTVDEFEKVVAEYAGAPYGVAVNSCTNALLLCFSLFNDCYIEIPKRTYVGVAQAIKLSGNHCNFTDEEWIGDYRLYPTTIVDSARRFTYGMYKPNELRCLSFHWGKHLKIGRGGMILTDDIDAYLKLRKMRFDGRREGVPAKLDNFDTLGYHCIMHPDDAARGLALMHFMDLYNDDLPTDDYADLSQFEIFTKN
jgi:dTDP-4-amino-4,6-dideoxygalactose transaminase